MHRAVHSLRIIFACGVKVCASESESPLTIKRATSAEEKKKNTIATASNQRNTMSAARTFV